MLFALSIVSTAAAEPAPTTSVGQRVYAEHCASCHGIQGQADGPKAASSQPRPRDFTKGLFKLKSTPGSEPPTLADVEHSIADGMPGTSMQAWRDVLNAAEIEAVANYVRDLGPLRQWSPPEHATVPPAQELAAASVEHGRELYLQLGCPACHGQEGRGDGSAASALKDVWNQPDPPRDLTAPWTLRGGDTPQALYLRIASGMPGTPMPGYAEAATPADIAAVVAYLRASARTPVPTGVTPR